MRYSQLQRYIFVEWMKQCDIWVNGCHKGKSNHRIKASYFPTTYYNCWHFRLSVAGSCGSMVCYLLTFLQSQFRWGSVLVDLCQCHFKMELNCVRSFLLLRECLCSRACSEAFWYHSYLIWIFMSTWKITVKSCYLSYMLRKA